MRVEIVIHKRSVVLTHAEAKCPALCNVQKNFVHLLHNEACSLGVAIKNIVELRFIVSAIGPVQIAQIDTVRNAEVLKRR